MPHGRRETRIDGLLFDRAPDESPGANLGIDFGRLFALFGDQLTAPTAVSSGGPDKVVSFGVKSELRTIQAAASTTTLDTSILPGNSLILAVTGRVVTAIPTATTFNVGDGTTAARFATGIAVAANTTFAGFLHWSGAVSTLAAGPSQAANAGIVITPNSTPGAATGVIRLYVAYLTFAAPSG